MSAGGIASSIDEIMLKADVVIANTGHGGVISPDKVREGQVIIALSEPRPEIEPYDAQLAGAAFAADAAAMRISSEIAVAFTASAPSNTPGAAVEPEDFVPTPLDSGVHARIAAAVARIAVVSGLAGRSINERLLSPEVFDEVIRDERQLPLE